MVTLFLPIRAMQIRLYLQSLWLRALISRRASSPIVCIREVDVAPTVAVLGGVRMPAQSEGHLYIRSLKINV